MYLQSLGTKTPCWDTNDLVMQEKQTDHICFSLSVINCRAVNKGEGLGFPLASMNVIPRLFSYNN